MNTLRGRLLLCLLTITFSSHAIAQPTQTAPSQTPLTADNLDSAAFAAWVDGAEQPMSVKDGPRHVVWTQTTPPEWDGVRYGDSKNPGPRHLRIGWKTALPVGSVLARSGGVLSALKPGAAYPGNLGDEAQWIPAQRILGSQIVHSEPGQEEYALWVFPAGTTTRALRFTHTAALTDTNYYGWLGGVYVLSDRLANIAPQAVAAASARNEAAAKINNGTNDGTWPVWDNGPDGAQQVVSPEHPEWVMLVWPRAVTLSGLNALWAGFGAAEVQAYTGPATRHPAEATDADWKTLKSFDTIQNQYPRALGVNWLDFGQAVTTRAIRLRITKVTREDHPHLNGKTQGGKRVWLGELMALQPLGTADVRTALLPLPAVAQATHPPIPIRFTLKQPGNVTLVIDDANGRRVRNLIADTPFPAGPNVVWWDGMDDLLRDEEAARHGVYHIPAQFVQPGTYHVSGIVHKPVELRYEFSVYSGGHPAWDTADGTGGWLTNHTPPASTLFVPADKAPGGKPLVYLGSFVSEGGSGLAWVDLNGNKQGGRGWVGGNWTAAPYLARDAGDQAAPGVYAYVGAAWSTDTEPPKGQPKQAEIRLTALTAQGDKPLPRYLFTPPRTKDKADDYGIQLGGIAVHNGLLVASLTQMNRLLVVDVLDGKIMRTFPVDNPRGVAFDERGNLLVLSGKTLVRFDSIFSISGMSAVDQLFNMETLVKTGLDDPSGITTDAAGHVYISDHGDSHQVKVFDATGRFLRAIGHPGAPKAGPYDVEHMNNPKGLTVDSDNHLWVAEEDYQPKRVSVWTLDGKLWKTFYGPARYGGGGKIDPQDKTRFYYDGMEFKLDWKTGTNQVMDVFFRPGPDAMPLPSGFGNGGPPEAPVYVNGHQYMTNCYNSNPTNGASIAMLWLLRNGIAAPVAALGRANDWDLLKDAQFKPRWPADTDAGGDYWKNQTLFSWSDLNGDGNMQPDEVTIVKASPGGVTVMPDLAMIESRADGKTLRYAPARFTAAGAPIYDLTAGQTLATDVQGPTSSGGDQALLGTGGWTVLTVAPKPFAPQSLTGVKNGVAAWSYPSLWPGLHASHESPPPDHPGEIIGTTRLLGGFVTPKGDAGPVWCVNGNQGNMYLFTQDGLFVSQLFQDVRQGKTWTMPVAQRNMLLNDVTLHDENFFPSISQTSDGQIYLVDGARSSLVRIDGLDSVQRVPATTLTITANDLKSAQSYFVQSEAQRQQAQGQGTLRVALRTAAPVVDGNLNDWQDAAWASIDKQGVAAYFNSNSKPFDVTGAVAIAGDRLYAAWRTGDQNLLRNSGETPNAPFKTGGALDLMIGADPAANDKRTQPVAGDERLLITQVKDKTLALLYRAVVPGTTQPVPFSSPWRTITIDRVEDISAQVQLAADDKGNYEISVPLAALGLKPQPGTSIRGDIGILRGNGFQTVQRAYWSNKATGITADVPSEAMLTPQLWGKWEFVAAP